MMRLLYFVLFLTLPISTRIYFRRRKTINSPKSFYGRTIYVSNQAASFMDPLLVASMRRPRFLHDPCRHFFTLFETNCLGSTHAYLFTDNKMAKEIIQKMKLYLKHVLKFSRLEEIY
jgi:hypothetical protein